MPGPFERYWASWKVHHPGWSFVTWTDAMLPPLRNQAAFDAASSLAMRADIARYELLYAYGGIYVDADFEALRNIEPLIAGADCFAAWQDDEYICNAILGSVPRYPLVRTLLDTMPRSIQEHAHVNVAAQTGPGLLTRTLAPHAADPNLALKLLAPALVYPYHWTEPQREGDHFPDAYAVHHWSASWVTTHRIRAGLARTRPGAAFRDWLHSLKQHHPRA